MNKIFKIRMWLSLSQAFSLMDYNDRFSPGRCPGLGCDRLSACYFGVSESGAGTYKLITADCLAYLSSRAPNFDPKAWQHCCEGDNVVFVTGSAFGMTWGDILYVR
ncbi:MAG: hypothetical protein ACFCU6_15615 [Balneolaceae bacterium]